MRTTSSAETIVRAWELCEHAPQSWRPAALLAALSERSLHETLALGVARRDSSLLAWRVALFGSRWTAFASCPNCAAMLEYELPLTVDALVDSENEIRVEVDRQVWHLRWPDSLDIADAAACRDHDEGRRLLMQRCLPQNAPEEILPRLIDALAERHRACSTVNLVCCECGMSWESVLDAGEFLWREIRAAAKRLLREVDAIARIYGWSEREILGLTQTRRNFYLELVQ